MLTLAALACQGESFGFRMLSRRVSRNRRIAGEQSERFADQNQNNADDSWSKKGVRKSSPLQVRNRVKAVLEKARNRTGIDNSATKASNIVADAASIGGLGEDVVIQVKKGSNLDLGLNAVSSPIPRFPDEDLVVERKKENGAAQVQNNTVRKPKEFDEVTGGFPAANSQYIEPMPFKLPTLNAKQIRRLQAGERIQDQVRMGREGSGYVILDVFAPPYVVWECLLDFETYPETIPTVREMQLYTSEKLNTGYVNEKPVLPGTGRETRHYGTPSVTRASFVLSKFRLNIAAVHRYTPHPDGDYMEFNLDRSCTNMVLKGAKGIWHTQENPDGREVCSSILTFIYHCTQPFSHFYLFHLFIYTRGTHVSTFFAKCKSRGLSRPSSLTTPPIERCQELQHG
jgi:hypothetical protein